MKQQSELSQKSPCQWWLPVQPVCFVRDNLVLLRCCRVAWFGCTCLPEWRGGGAQDGLMSITMKYFISCGLCSCLTSTKLDRYGRFWADSYVQRNHQKTHVLELIVAVAHCKCFFSMILLQSVEFLWHFLPFLSWWNRFFVCSFSSYSFLFCLRIITRTNPLILQCPEWKFVVCKLWTLNILPARSCWVVPLRSRFSSWGCLYVPSC